MSLITRLLAYTTFFLLLLPHSAPAKIPTSDFANWRQELRSEALVQGISAQTFDRALPSELKLLPRVIELDRNQPEFKQSLSQYVANRVTAKRIAAGKKMLERYPTWLGKIEKKYGVPRAVIVALWGIETSYGQHTGSFSVIQSLTTLAHDGRRAAYFRSELLDALHILEDGHIRLKRMKGSWAGAMGQCQFMPSSFRRYAIDADGDKRIDIWSSTPDVLASAANYLARSGWKPNQRWGEKARVPQGLDRSRAGLKTRLTLADWQALGVLPLSGEKAADPEMQASLIFADDVSGSAYLVYDNFRVIRRWNTANAFAVAIGTLADQIGE